MCYNYLEAVRNDVAEYVNNEINLSEFYTIEEAEERLQDVLWAYDPVTGNGSGSYTFNRYQAEQNLCGNWDLAAESMNEFCDDRNPFELGAEAVDVTIRCYLLSQAISEVLTAINEERHIWD